MDANKVINEYCKLPDVVDAGQTEQDLQHTQEAVEDNIPSIRKLKREVKDGEMNEQRRRDYIKRKRSDETQDWCMSSHARSGGQEGELSQPSPADED